MQQHSVTMKSSLMFVVRDYAGAESDGYSSDNDDDFPCGTEGGKRYFQTITQDNSPNTAKEHEIMQDFLVYSFGNDIPCCLLPHPGKAIRRKSCRVADLNKEFQRQCFNLFQKITNNEEVKIKNMQEVVCTCKTLCETIQDYVDLFGPNLAVDNQNSLSQIKRLASVKLSSYFRKYVNQYIDLCQQAVKANCRDTFKAAIKFETTKQNSVLNFKKEIALLYPPTVVTEWEEELNRVLSQIKINLVTCMFIEKAYKEAILEFNEWQKSNIGTRSKDEAKKFVVQAEEKRSSLLRKMEEKIRRCPEKTDRFEEIFSQSKEYFLDHTNKVAAAIDKDNARFLTAMSVLDFVFKEIGIALTFAIPKVAAIATPLLLAIKEPSKPLGKYVTKKVMSYRIKDKTRSSLGLQNYRNGEMQVELSFGTINFEFDIGKQLSA